MGSGVRLVGKVVGLMTGLGLGKKVGDGKERRFDPLDIWVCCRET